MEENLPSQSGLTFMWTAIPSFVWEKKGVLHLELLTQVNSWTYLQLVNWLYYVFSLLWSIQFSVFL